MENSPELQVGKPELDTRPSRRPSSVLGQALSPAMKKAWNVAVRHPELTQPEQAAKMGRTPDSFKGSLASAKVRLGHEGPVTGREALVEDGSDTPSRNDEVGLTLESQQSSRRIIKQLKEVKTEALEKLTANVAFNALESLGRVSPDEWDSIDVKARSIAAGIMIDKRQILRGEPTVITEVRDHRRLDEVGKALLQEMQRRGIEIDVTDYQATESAETSTSIPADIE